MGMFDRLFKRTDTVIQQPFSVKESAVGSLIAAYSLGKPVWNKRDFAKVAQEGYQQNIIVYACVWLTARAAAHIPLSIMIDNGKASDKAETGKFPDLMALLNRPNPVQDGVAFRQDVFSDFLLGGNAFIERVDLYTKPKELYSLRPDRMRVIPGERGWPQGYVYQTASGKKQFDVDPTRPEKMPIFHMKDYSPVDDFYGMSAIDPAAFAVDGHTGVSAWNKALIDNGARPSGVMVYDPKEGPASLTEDQFARLKSELEQSYTGAANAGRPMLFDGGLNWQQLGLSPSDMDWVNGKNSVARDIALAFGVPPMLLGIPGDNTYSNYQEANKAFYRQTVIPLVGQFCRGLNWWILPSYGKNISLEPDLDDLPIFAEEREAYWDRIEAATDLTINEKRAAKGYPPVNGGDVILVSSTMIPLESAGAQIAGGPEPEDDQIEGDDEAENESADD